MTSALTVFGDRHAPPLSFAAMPDFRVYCLPTEPEPTSLRLSVDESHHLVVVNRARRGDPVIAFDGRGTEWVCSLAADAKAGAVLQVRQTRRAPPLPHALTLAQAMPKGTGMEDIVRKATELGAARIVPLYSDRTQVHLESGRQDKKIEKWRVTALEAAKQCGNPWLPEIAPVLTLTSFLATHAAAATPTAAAYDLKLLASLQAEARPLKNVLAETAAALRRAPRRVLWLIGPEGDFSPGEAAAAAQAGFVPVTLGPLVLRCETAAIYALSVLSHELSAAS